MNGAVVDVMRQRNEAVRSWLAAVNGIEKYLLRVWVVLLPIQCINIVVHYMVAHGTKISQARAVATLIRRTQICWKESENVNKCHLVFHNLIHPLLVGQC